jgi:surface carbohydrate biosynthesis protein
MLKSIKKIWRGAQFFFRAKKQWGSPKHSEVLIFDAARLEILMDYLGPWKPEVLHLRSEQINISVAFSSLFRSGKRFDNYVECYIEKVRPRLIITFVDNSGYFYTISKKYPKIKTMFIQNGLRTYDLYYYETLDESVRNKFYVDYMLVFGEFVGAYFKKVVGGEVLPMGSIVNNSVPKECQHQPGVLAYLSQWDQESGFISEGILTKVYPCSYKDYELKPDHTILKFLLRYADEKNKRLMIIPKYQKGDDLYEAERAYFRASLGCEPEFLETEGSYPGYRAVDNVDVLVSVDSTLAYESLARGNKVAFFSIRLVDSGTPVGDFGWPVEFSSEGLFWTNRPDPNSFDRILDYLFEVDDEQWQKDVQTANFSSIMAYDPGNTILKSTFKKVLGTLTTSEH